MALPAKTNIRVDALLDSAQRNLEAAKLNAYPSSIVDSVLSCLVEGLACTMLNQQQQCDLSVFLSFLCHDCCRKVALKPVWKRIGGLSLLPDNLSCLHMQRFFGLEATFTGDDTNRKMVILPYNGLWPTLGASNMQIKQVDYYFYNLKLGKM